jgi:hypothetical protein
MRIDNIVSPTLGGSNRTVVFDLVERNAARGPAQAGVAAGNL